MRFQFEPPTRVLRYLAPLLFFTATAVVVGAQETAGIGVSLATEGQSIVVKEVLPDSPAAVGKSIHIGDRVIAVAQGNEPGVEVKTLRQAVSLIRGPKGTTVRLTITSGSGDDSTPRVVSFARGDLAAFAHWGDGVLLINGTKAPDIEMTALPDGVSERLSLYAGKIVVLEFWATWCGPCQKAMAELQEDLRAHPEWKDKVVVIAASVDDEMDPPVKHLKAKGWDQTHNVWVKAPAIKAYHVDGIPTKYVIGRNGNILAVNPRDIPQAVNQELPRGTKAP